MNVGVTFMLNLPTPVNASAAIGFTVVHPPTTLLIRTSGRLRTDRELFSLLNRVEITVPTGGSAADRLAGTSWNEIVPSVLIVDPVT